MARCALLSYVVRLITLRSVSFVWSGLSLRRRAGKESSSRTPLADAAGLRSRGTIISETVSGGRNRRFTAAARYRLYFTFDTLSGNVAHAYFNTAHSHLIFSSLAPRPPPSPPQSLASAHLAGTSVCRTFSGRAITPV